LAKQTKPEAAFWEDLCFHAQQAAERAIKAVYQHKDLLHHYTHDIHDLVQGLGESGIGLGESGITITPVVSEAAVLTRYASQTRYPGAFEPVSRMEYQEAVRLAESVVAWAEEHIGVRRD
jgi:HEPN domain-containing protein